MDIGLGAKLILFQRFIEETIRPKLYGQAQGRASTAGAIATPVAYNSRCRCLHSMSAPSYREVYDFPVPDTVAGIVTLTSSGRTTFQNARLSSGGSRRLPCAHRFTSELAKGLSGDEVTLDIEGVVDGSVDGQELLR